MPRPPLLGQGPTPPGLRFPAPTGMRPDPGQRLGGSWSPHLLGLARLDCSHLHSSRASSRREAPGGHSRRPGSSGTLAPHPPGASPYVWPSAAGASLPPQSQPSWGPEAAEVHPGWGHSPWEWLGSPAGPRPGLEQLGLDGRKGGYLQLPQAGVGLGRNTMAYEGPKPGTPPPRPQGSCRLAGLPLARPSPEERAQEPQVAGSRGSPRGRETC